MRRILGAILLLAGLAAVAGVATSAPPRASTTAQEATQEGRLGGGAPLDATAPPATLPPTATATPAGSPGATTPVASPLASPVAGGPAPASPVAGGSAASPSAGGPLAPVACAVAPRTLAGIGELLGLPGPPGAPAPPTPKDWTPEVRAMAEAVVAELVACGNAGRQLAAYALLTDAALVATLVGVSQAEGLATVDAVFLSDAPPLAPATITGLETRAGDPGAVYLWLDLGGQGLAARVDVAEERGAWRVAAIEVVEPETP